MATDQLIRLRTGRVYRLERPRRRSGLINVFMPRMGYYQVAPRLPGWFSPVSSRWISAA